MVCPSPELLAEQARSQGPASTAFEITDLPSPLGFNDGIHRPDQLAQGLTALTAPSAKPRLRGTVNAFIVLVQFSDIKLKNSVSHFNNLFFSSEDGYNSAHNYFKEVSNGLIQLKGTVVGPYTLPHPVSYYAGSGNGTQQRRPNARTMANEVANLIKDSLDVKFDNDADGYVDSFIIVHAGRGAEETGKAADIWSHKWVMEKEVTSNNVKLFSYLTVPDDSRVGVCVHEIGHLIFGFPDMYGPNGIPGLGDFCLMAGGSWGGSPPGSQPTHPNVLLKSLQGWAQLTTVHDPRSVLIPDVKSPMSLGLKLIPENQPSSRYFVVENRQKSNYDASLPAQGLLVYSVNEDKYVNGNFESDASNFFMTLIPADDSSDLKTPGGRRASDGFPFPGYYNNVTFNDESSPSSKIGGKSTSVSITSISKPDPTMTATVSATAAWGRAPEPPALCSLNGKLHAAFRDSDNSNGVRIARSDDGSSWTTVEVNDQRAPDGLAMVSFQENLYVAYKGNNNKNLYLTTPKDGGNNWDIIPFFDVSVAERPAITVFQNELYIAFCQTTDSNVTVMRSADGRKFSSSVVNDVSAVNGVEMAIFQDRLYIVYHPSDAEQEIKLVSSGDGTTWEHIDIPSYSSGNRPALAAFDGKLCLFYTQLESQKLVSCVSHDGSTWEQLYNDDIRVGSFPRVAVADMPSADGIATSLYISYLPVDANDFALIRLIGN